LYEKAFNTKVAHIMKYSDAPAEEGYAPPPGTENYVMHATLPIGDTGLMVCDAPDGKYTFGDGISLHAGMDNEESLKAAFNVLKDGGKVLMDIQSTFWSENFAMVIDKFGINWMLSI